MTSLSFTGNSEGKEEELRVSPPTTRQATIYFFKTHQLPHQGPINFYDAQYPISIGSISKVPMLLRKMLTFGQRLQPPMAKDIQSVIETFETSIVERIVDFDENETESDDSLPPYCPDYFADEYALNYFIKDVCFDNVEDADAILEYAWLLRGVLNAASFIRWTHFIHPTNSSYSLVWHLPQYKGHQEESNLQEIKCWVQEKLMTAYHNGEVVDVEAYYRKQDNILKRNWPNVKQKCDPCTESLE